MQVLSFDEVQCVNGAGVTENQCIGAFSLAGGFIGGTVTASATYGFGTSAGWGLGFAGGAALGMILCRYRANAD